MLRSDDNGPATLAEPLDSVNVVTVTGGIKRIMVLFLALASSVAVLTSAGPAAAQSTGNGLSETSVNTFRLDPEAGVLRVQVDITLRNVTSDRREGNQIVQTYFDGYFVAVPFGAENIVATRNGSVLTGEVVSDPDFPAFQYYEFALGQRLFNGSSTTVTVTYDHLGAGPRNDIPWRVNAAYTSFIAYGFGDEGQVTINVVQPDGYEFDDFTELDGYEASAPDETGAVTHTRIGDEDVETLIGMSNDDALALRQLDVDGADVEIRSWPDDLEWSDFVTDHVERGIPALEELIGSDWPVNGEAAVIQTVEPSLYGYAGWFDPASSEISMGEELDGETIYHELSHAWFNGDLVDERWMIEGLAQIYAAELVRADGDTPVVPTEPTTADPGYRKLARWDNGAQSDSAEAYGYNASFWVLEELVDQIGYEAMGGVVTALADGTSPYIDERAIDRVDDWKRVYDLFVEVGGADVPGELFSQFVITREDHPLIEQRDQAAADVEALGERVAPWTLPTGIRAVLERWELNDIEQAIDDTDAVLEQRSELDSLRTDTGVDEPDEVSDAFGKARRTRDRAIELDDVADSLDAAIARGTTLTDRIAVLDGLASETATTPPPVGSDADAADFATAVEIVDDQVAALEDLRDAIALQESTDGFLQGVGLIGTDVDADLGTARAAAADGDADAVRTAASNAVATLDAADDLGTERATIVGIALGGFLVLLTLTIVLLRRRRRARRTQQLDAVAGAERSGATDEIDGSGSGGVGGGELLGGSHVDLEEDALTRAHLGGVDDGLDVPVRDLGETP